MPNDAKFLLKLGIEDPLMQEILVEALPCGIESVEEAWNDKTPVQINAPRVLLICVFRGMVIAFRKLEKARLET